MTMRFAAFTVDVDRDVNVPLKGQVEAGCRRGRKRFTSSAEGFVRLIGLLDELGIKGTFFLEGETLEHLAEVMEVHDLLRGHEAAAHGYAHEDLTGEDTGIEPSAEWVDAIIGRSTATVERVMGHRPAGFRAPYQHTNHAVFRSLKERGYLYDSSAFADLSGRSVTPYRAEAGIIEVPLASGRSPSGGTMQSYLWPLHEGKRAPSDLGHLMDQYDQGLFVLADHTWHITESLAGPRGEAGTEEEMEKIRAVIQEALDRGIGFMTVEGYLRREVGT